MSNFTHFNQTIPSDDEKSLAELCKNFYLVLFLCIIFVLIVSANISVILRLSCSKNRHSRMSFFLLNLAYADLFVGIIIVTRDIIEKSCIPFLLGSIGCRLLSFIQVTIAYNSSYVLVCVSIDRLYAIVRPMDVRTASSAFRYSLIIASWIISITCASTQLYMRDLDFLQGMPVCGNRSDVRNWNAYVYFLFISLYLVPLIVMTLSYVIIIVLIWKKSSLKIKTRLTSERKERSKFRRLLSTKKSFINDDHHIELSIRNARSLGVIPRAKIKTVKMTLVIVLAFTACWSPYFLLTIMNSFNLIHSNILILVTSSLCYMNSLANPLIYWLFATNFCLQCRKKYGYNQSIRTALAGDTVIRESCSLTESRFSFGNSRKHRRLSEYRRAHNPRSQIPLIPTPRLINYRAPPSVYARASKRMAQHQNSQASLLHGFPYQH